MLSNILFILGVLAFTFALRSFHHPLLQKLGALGVFTTSFLCGWLLLGSPAIGAALASSWLLLPWLDLLTRIRKVTIPFERNLLQKTPPNSHTFPALAELTTEVEGEGFEHAADTGWEWQEYQQFFRLFYRSNQRLQAAICLVDQEDVAFYYIAVSSRRKDGTVWTTWNYPFSYSLKLAPEWHVLRLRGDKSFLEIIDAHERYLQENGIEITDLEELDPERIPEELQKDLRVQITHNVASGVLTATGSGEVKYSWRGLFYLWFQFLRDIVRI